MHPACYEEGHNWGGGKCLNCGEQFRCMCGRFLRVEDQEAHWPHCPTLQAIKQDEYDKLHDYLLGEAMM